MNPEQTQITTLRARNRELEAENWLLSHQQHQGIISIITQLRSEIAARIRQHLDSYWSTPHLINQLNADLLRNQFVHWDQLDQLRPLFWQQLHLYPEVNAIQFANRYGDYRSIIRMPDQTFIYEVKDASIHQNKLAYQLNEEGRSNEKIVGFSENYDPRIRQWYQIACEQQRQTWSQMYQFSTNSAAVIGVMAVMPVVEHDRLVGVLGSDITPWQLSDFLSSLEISASGLTFLIDREGYLIASSVIRKPFIIESNVVRQIKAIQCEHPIIQSVAAYLQTKFGNFDQIIESTQLDFILEDQRQFIQIDPFADQHGMNGLIVVVIPESDFSRSSVSSYSQIRSAFEALDAAKKELEHQVEKRTEQLRKTESELRALFAAMTEMIFVLDRYGKLVNMINTKQSFLDQGSDLWVGRTLNDAFSRKLASRFLDLIRKSLEQNQPIEVEYKVLIDQQKKWFSATISPINQDTVLWVARDVTEQVKLKLSLQKAKKVAEIANQTKSEFLAKMSHELRTPLNAILGLTELMNTDPNQPIDQQKNLSTINRSGEHLLSLINNILEMSKIEANKLEIVLAEFDLPELVTELMNLLKQKAAQKGLVLNSQIDPNVPQFIQSDPVKLRQVLLNLLGNAIKFTSTGSIDLRINQKLSPDPSVLRLLFSIKDTGIGIAASEIETIFDAFAQAKAPYRYQEGSGLGLSISRELVRLLGGSIGVNSHLGHGSTFWFDISVPASPAQLSPSDPGLPTIKPTPTQNSISLVKPLRILLADDNIVNQMVATQMLNRLHYSADVVSNGLEVMEALQQQAYDLILMDIQMPEMDGIEATRHICQRWNYNQRPVIIAITANAMKEDRERCLSAGMDDYISKPIRLEKLQSVLSIWEEVVRKKLTLPSLHSE